MNRKLRSFLRRRGATPDEIARAERAGRLPLLAVDRQLMPGEPRYTFAEACRRASFDVETARRLWRALGFPDAPPDERLFRDNDVETICSFLRRRGATPDEIARAERAGRLPLLAVDRQLMPGEPRYTFAEACRRASFDVETARRLWRALGFPDAPPDERLFRDNDVETI